MQGLLKFITCGSVDDGKSTLIGHLLYDAKLIYADQEEALILDSKIGSRGGDIDYSLLLDGLMAEREQGITIDVAYRYFTTDNRSFICADTPGHEEYTRNMACGASFADLAVILVDARKGVLTQTRRHARICALMGIRFFVFAINKMDLIDYDEAKFKAIEKDILALKDELLLENITLIPVSATGGDNIMEPSTNTPWYTGKALLPYLETVDVSEKAAEEGFYMPVQRVCRPSLDFRGFQGQVESGAIRVGDTVCTFPSGEKAEVTSINIAGRDSKTAEKGQPATIALSREVDVSRGCVLEKDSGITLANTFEADLFWMDDTPLTLGKNFLVRLGTKKIPGLVTRIDYRVDINSGEHIEAENMEKNEIARVEIAVTEPIVIDTFNHHRTQGELILIDRITNMTSACGTVQKILENAGRRVQATPKMRAALNWQESAVIVFRPGEDGSTLTAVEEAEYRLVRASRHTYVYVPERGEDYRRTAEHLKDAGLVVLVVLQKEQTESIAGAKYWREFARGKDATAETIASAITASTMAEALIEPNNWII
jgi:sulfate adenylyltransferase, large subunit